MKLEKQEISQGDIEQAYKKLMAFVYYDKSNTNLVLRKKLAKQAANNSVKDLFTEVQDLLNSDDPYPPVLEKISYQIIPKGFSTNDGNSGLVTNNRILEKNDLTGFNLIFDAPLSIYLLSILWLIKVGYKLDKNLNDHCYGNRLLLNESETGVVSGRGLLKPYIHQYQKWRDNSVKIAKQQLEQETDVGFVNLDITGYYYNVRLDWTSLELGNLPPSTSRLNKLLKKVHQKYTIVVSEGFPKKYKLNFAKETVQDIGKVILPIGLPSSYTLANHYLHDFDQEVLNQLQPVYYGRYVDDILIVLPRPKKVNSITEETSKKYLSNLLSEHNLDFKPEQVHDLPNSTKFCLLNLSEILKIEYDEFFDPESASEDEFKKTENYTLKIKSDDHDLLHVQNRKVMIYEFLAGQSLSAIEKLKHDLDERSSEFRYIPTASEANFDADAFHLLYDDSFGKPRTLKDYKESKLGLSTYLYKRSAVALWADKTETSDEAKKIVAFFNGVNIVNYYQQWERVLTYLVIADRKKELIKLIKTAFREIDKISIPKPKSKKEALFEAEHVERETKNTLIEYLSISLAQACTLNPSFFNDWLQNRLYSLVKNRKVENWIPKTNDLIRKLRKSFLVRNFYVTKPLLEFTEYALTVDKNDKLPSLIESTFDFEKNESSKFRIEFDQIEENKIAFPRFVKFYECCLFQWYQSLVNPNIKTSEGKFYTDDYLPENFLNGAFNHYWQANYSITQKKPGFRESRKEELFQLRNQSQKRINGRNREKCITEILINPIEKEHTEDRTLNLGLANIEVDWPNKAANSLKGRPVVNRERYSRIGDILNKFEEEEPKSEICIFPEISVPHDFTSLLSEQAMRHQKTLIFGTEHINTGKLGYNFIMTVLPVSLDQMNDAVFLPRLKNHYSPEEKFQIGNHHLNCVNPNTEHYHLIHLKNTYFTTFYCYELADIEHRSWFRSKIDLLIASEFNRDVNYFSNLVESTARDLNTFVTQVNTSDWGDSRITQPSKTYDKDLIRIKGGENDVVIIGKLNLTKFRKFQEVGFGIQKEEKVYKPSPPNFDIEFVKRRINNKWIINDIN